MYKSPIELLIRDYQHQVIEREKEQVYRAAVQVVPNIDKDELLRALAYDRGQYQRGYLDGLHDAAPRWIPVEERLPATIPCAAGTEYSEAVNVLTSGRKVLTAIWDGSEFIADAAFWDAEGEDITHWTPVLLPLPEPPKGE